MKMPRTIFVLILHALLHVGFAGAAQAGTSSRASYWERGTAGVGVEAYFYSPPSESASSSASYVDSSSGDGGYSATSFEAEDPVPAAEDFFFAGAVDIPDPCIRRKFGGDYCSPAPPPKERPGKRGRAAPPPPSPEEIAATAIDRAVALAPDPQLEVAPGELGMTGLDSFFWVADPPEPITTTAGVPGLTVTAQAVPSQFVWNFGDGDELVTTSPGAPWNRSTSGRVKHMYETKGIYDISVEVIWEASYSVNGGAWTSIGSFSPSDSRRYAVQEMVAVLVEAR